MATLAGSTIASTYTYLLKMDGTSGLTSSLVAVQDGDATDSALSISTTSASIGHTVTTAASTPIALLIDANTSGDAAQNSVGMHLDFDRTGKPPLHCLHCVDYHAGYEHYQQAPFNNCPIALHVSSPFSYEHL